MNLKIIISAGVLACNCCGPEGKWSLEVGWLSFSVRQTQRRFDLLVRITCIFQPSSGKSQPFSEMAYALRPMGELAELWESAYLEESAQLCLT